MAALVVVVLALVAQTPPGPAPKGLTPEAEAELRRALVGEEGPNREKVTRLGGYTPAAFPLYARILGDPKESRFLVQAVLSTLTRIDADRSQFTDAAVAKLAHRHPGVRWTAVKLLGQIGTPRDTPPLVALLGDEEFTNGIAAAKAIQAIGGPRDLAALDTWLVVSARKAVAPEFQGRYDLLRDEVEKARDALKDRLDKERKIKS